VFYIGERIAKKTKKMEYVGIGRVAFLFLCIMTVQAISITIYGLKMEDIGYEIARQRATIDDFVYLTERLQMYDKNISNKVIVNGVYFMNDDYYCVWAKDRDPVNIGETEAHEYCHFLIDNGERDHFCGDD